ncbi:hypothetical protein CCACVL1_04708, partial [Corchorus capsularis]
VAIFEERGERTNKNAVLLLLHTCEGMRWQERVDR